MKLMTTLLTLTVLTDLLLAGSYLLWAHHVVDPQQPDASVDIGVDVGVVFFSDFDPHGGLGEDSRRRVDHAARLYADGVVPALLCVGGHRHHPRRDGAQLMAARLREHGVPARAIHADQHSFDTLSNWSEAVPMLNDAGQQRPLLISDPLHLARIRSIAATPYPIAMSATRSIPAALREQPLHSWLLVHREWVAWATGLLPTAWQQSLTRDWRDFWNPSSDDGQQK